MECRNTELAVKIGYDARRIYIQSRNNRAVVLFDRPGFM